VSAVTTDLACELVRAQACGPETVHQSALENKSSGTPQPISDAVRE
jgi:hypothetical protein